MVLPLFFEIQKDGLSVLESSKNASCPAFELVEIEEEYLFLPGRKNCVWGEQMTVAPGPCGETARSNWRCCLKQSCRAQK